jgi:DNA-binding transcriptional LysR family regulator
MTLRHMKIFAAVCDCQSATAAAEKLGIAQPAVSLAVKELENHYGVRLFDRISHKLWITEEGKELLRFARRILSLFDAAEYDIKSRDSFGALRVGSSITVGTCLMPEYVKRFRAARPKTRVLVTVDNSAAIEKKILKNQLDFALIEGVVHSPQIVSRRFMKDRLAVVCGAGSAFARRTELPPEELPNLPFILREKGSGTRELFDSALLTRGIKVTPEWESVSTEAIVRAVSCGLGLSVLPFRLVERELARKSLAELHIKGLKFERYFSLIYHKDKHLSRSILEFFKIMRLPEAAEQ